MLHRRGMSSAPSPAAVQTGPDPAKTGLIIRRILRDYVSRRWGLLALAILCMLLTSVISGLVPLIVNWEVKQIFLRRQAELLVPLSLAIAGVVISIVILSLSCLYLIGIASCLGGVRF